MACDPLSSDGGGCELSDVAMAPATAIPRDDWSVAAGRSFLPRLDRIHISRPAPSPGVAFPGHDRPRPAQQHELGLSASAPHGSLPLRLQCSWMWEQPLQLSQPSQRSQPRQLVDLNQSTDEPPLAVLTQEKGAQHAASSLPSSHSPTALASQRAFALQDWGQAVHSPLKKPRGSPEAIGRQAVALAISEREEEIFQRRREQRLRILGGLRHALDEPAAACAAAAAGLDGQSPLFVLRQGPFSCRISSRACNAEKAGSQGGVTEMRESGDATGGGAVEGGDTTAARFAPGVWGEAGANDGGGGLGRRSDEVCNGAGALAEPRTLGATLAVELRSTMRVEVTSPHAAALASLDARKALPFLAAPFAPLPAGWKQQRRVRARSAFESRDLMSGGGEGFPGSPGRAELLAEGALRSPALARKAAECGKRAQKRRNSSEWELYAGGEEARGEWGRGETGGPADTGRGGRSSRGGDSSVETRRDGTGQGEGGGEAEQGGQHEVESRGGAQKEMEKEGVREEEWEWERAKVRREEGQGTFDMLTWEQGQGQGQGQQAEMRWQTIGPPWLTPGQAEQQQLEQQKGQGAEQQQWWQQGGAGKQRGMEGLVEEGVRAPLVPYLRSASQSHVCSPLILTPFSAPHTRDRLLGGAGGRLGAAAGPAAAAAPAAAAHRRAASSVPILGGTLAVSRVGQVDSESGGVLSSSGVAGGAAEFPLWVRNSEAETYLHSAAQPVLLAESMGES
ncbi:unnamed protein product [Closterium sp. NIES-64]|nr:unnamed protein product [Closterium sp. NIES-64]